MASFWGFPCFLQTGTFGNVNRHYEVHHFESNDSISPSQESIIEDGEISEGEIGDGESLHSRASSSSENEFEEKKVLKSSQTRHHPAAYTQPNLKRSHAQKDKKHYKRPPIVDDESEEGAVSSESDLESGEMSVHSESETELKRRKKAVNEVRDEVMSRLQVEKPTHPVQIKVAEEAEVPVSKAARKDRIEKRKAKSDLPQIKESKKPAKQLQCYSEKDVDYRAMWIEQLDATKTPPNHPFFQISVRNVRTKPYCDLWESEEKKDYLYYKPGTWSHVKDIPRLSEENLSKLSISEAKQFVAWLLAERKVANAELLSLRRRFWAENQRHRNLKGYVSGEKKLPDNAVVQNTMLSSSNNPTYINADGLLCVSPKEQKRLLQGISKLWMTEETSNLLKQKQRVYAKMKKRGTEFFKNKFKELDRICRIEVKKAKQHWENYMMDCIRQNGLIVGSILDECVERVASGHIPPDPRILAAQQRRFWQQQGARRGGPAWARGGRAMRGRSRADQLQL